MLYSRAGSYPRGKPMLYAEDFSPNTPQGACPTCHGLGRIYDVTETSMVPDDSLTIRERAIAAWPPAWHGQNLRDILVTLGYDIDTPLARAAEKGSRLDSLYRGAAHGARVCGIHAGRDPHARCAARSSRATWAPSPACASYVLHTFATTQSALMKKRVARFMSGTLCPVCARQASASAKRWR